MAEAHDTPAAPHEEVRQQPPPGVVWNFGRVRELGKPPTPAQQAEAEKRFLAGEDLDD